MTQFRFPCRECGKVKVADNRTRAVLNGYVCGDCLGITCTVGLQHCDPTASYEESHKNAARIERIVEAALIEHDLAVLQMIFPGTL